MPDPLAEADRLQQQGDRPAALRLLNEAAAGFQLQGQREALYDTMMRMAHLHLQLAEAQRSLDLLLACIRLAQSIGNPLYLARSHLLSGICLGLLGRHAEAERQLLAVLAHARSDGLPARLHVCLSNLVLLHCQAFDDLRRSGRDAPAQAQLNQAARYAEEAEGLASGGDPYGDAIWRANRAGWLRRAGRQDQALPELDAVYRLATARGWVDVARHTSLGLGLAALAAEPGCEADPRDRSAEALQWLVRCVAVSEQPDVYGFVNHALHELAALCKAAGDTAAAQRHLAHSAQLQDLLRAERRRVADAIGQAAFNPQRALDGLPQPT